LRRRDAHVEGIDKERHGMELFICRIEQQNEKVVEGDLEDNKSIKLPMYEDKNGFLKSREITKF
jgi:hypothetical protein